MSEHVFNVTLHYPGPWGFRLAGGVDFNQPLSISRITPGGKGAVANILPNDVVLRIDGEDAMHMTHLDAQNKIKNCVGDLSLTLTRGEAKIWQPKVTPMSAAAAGHHNTPPYQVSLKADKYDDSPGIGSSHNTSAQPFPGSAKVVHLQYNSPVGIYSAQNIAETFKGQTEGLITGVVGGDSPGHVDTSSPAYQSVHGSGGPAYANPTAQSRSFKMLQDMTEEDGGGGAGNYGTPQGSAQPGFRSVRPPSGGAAIGNKPPQTTPMCEDCDRGIVGPFVRVKGKSYHPECFTCKACHCNLKNQGYFEVGGKLYCERDARERVQPPEGADVVSMPGRGGPSQGRPAPGHPSPGHPSPVRPSAVHPSPVRPSAVHPSPVRPSAVHPSPGHQSPGHQPQSYSSPSRPSPSTGPSYTPSYQPPQQSAVPAPPPPPPPAPTYAKPGFQRLTSEDVQNAARPMYRVAPPPDPNEIIARALAQNPDSTKDVCGIKPIFTPSQKPSPSTRSTGHSSSAFSSPTGSYDSGYPLTPPPLSPDERIAQALAAEGDIVSSGGVKVSFQPSDTRRHAHSGKPLSAPNQYAAAARGPMGPSKPLPPRPSGIPRQAIQRGAVTKSSVPPGTRTPMCDSCGETIRGPFVNAIGKNWHPDHFHCSHCSTNLMEMGFVEENGQLFCERDYAAYFAPNCSKCQQPIIGDVLNALEKSWHPDCFVCAQCHRPFSAIGAGSSFHVEDGMPYCEQDWNQMFTTKCSGCNYPIEPGDKWVEALDTQWHSGCFTCTVCHVNLEGQSFYAKSGKPYCRKHASG